MAKTLSEAPITTANARAKLALGVHWRGLDPDVHLGYRKGRRGGVWLVRWRNGVGYRQASLGAADDTIKVGTLDFAAASREARAVVEKARLEAVAEAAGPVLTVGSCVTTYIAARDARDSRRKGRTVRSDAGQRLSRYLIGQPARGRQAAIDAAPLASIPLHLLTEKDLEVWRTGLPADMKSATRQRLVNDLKAALNLAYADNRERLPATLPAAVKHALKALAGDDDDAVPVARDNQILSDGAVARLLRSAREIDEEQNWSGDLFRLVLVLAATGARFSQVTRMRVSDFQIAERRLLVPVSRKGRGGKSGAITVPVGVDVVEALVPVHVGRPADAVLLERWRNVQSAGGVAWHRDRRGPWHSAAEIARPWQLIRDRASIADVIPYALRHSSIVKAIKANLPLRLVAALHDTSTAMIERHYSKWITSGLEELARAAIVPLVPTDAAGVVQLRAGGSHGV